MGNKQICNSIFATNLKHLNKKIKVGIVSYLDSRPLIHGLKLSPISSQIELIEDNPARLSAMIKSKEIDLGLIPVATIPELEEYYLVGDYCIGADGEAVTVCLFSEVPLKEIRKVYLDYQSRTSVELLKWVMKEHWKIDPELISSTDEDYRNEIHGTTAGLVIGDRAFEQRQRSAYCYDLGLEWKNITGLPFVFAVWVSNSPLPEEFIADFNNANAMGLEQIDAIVNSEVFDLYDLRKYYSLHISYKLDEEKRKGMNKFLEIINPS